MNLQRVQRVRGEGQMTMGMHPVIVPGIGDRNWMDIADDLGRRFRDYLGVADHTSRTS